MLSVSWHMAEILPHLCPLLLVIAQGTAAEVSQIHHGIIWVGRTLATEDDFDEARDAIVACQSAKVPTLRGCVFLVMALDDCLDAVEECDIGVQINTKALDIEVTDFSSDLMRIDNVVGNVEMSDFMWALQNVFDGKEDEGWAAGAYRNGSPFILAPVITRCSRALVLLYSCARALRPSGCALTYSAPIPC